MFIRTVCRIEESCLEELRIRVCGAQETHLPRRLFVFVPHEQRLSSDDSRSYQRIQTTNNKALPLWTAPRSSIRCADPVPGHSAGGRLHSGAAVGDNQTARRRVEGPNEVVSYDEGGGGRLAGPRLRLDQNNAGKFVPRAALGQPETERGGEL